ncbi:hypothetical protein [Fibrella forsythiae]|uniref:Uncharacterized protein n=1 Tax=Fibrella forsythiae TaxID=2817061 RepID=A0ABS3JAC0_9BACT|nr:hypothetical protein [Fibrella forsythiae]MBO0946947.1 hypothetical protein [Fibrella forsythiae]
MLTFLSLVGIVIALIVVAAFIEGFLELAGFSEKAARGMRKLLFFAAYALAVHHYLQ